MKKSSLLAVILMMLMTGCIIVPEGGYGHFHGHHGHHGHHHQGHHHR